MVKNCSIEQLQNAVKESQVLCLSEDLLSVKRVKPYQPVDPRIIDRRTVYVDQLPPYITREKLKQIFSTYGEILYISLPMVSQKMKRLKGFALIEYSDDNSATQALTFDGHIIDDKEVLVIAKPLADSLFNAEKRENVQSKQFQSEQRVGSREVMKKKRMRVDEKFKKENKFQNYNFPPRSFNDRFKGTVLRFWDCAVTQGEKLLPIFKNAAPILYFDFKEGDNQGYLRVSNRKLGVNLISVFNENIAVGGEKMKMDFLTGEEEEEYINKIKSTRPQKKITKPEGIQSQSEEIKTTETPEASITIETIPKTDNNNAPSKHVFFSDSDDESPVTTTRPQKITKPEEIQSQSEENKNTETPEASVTIETTPKTDNNNVPAKHVFFNDSDDEFPVTTIPPPTTIKQEEEVLIKSSEDTTMTTLKLDEVVNPNEMLKEATLLPLVLASMLSDDNDDLEGLIDPKAEEGFIQPSLAKHTVFFSDEE